MKMSSKQNNNRIKYSSEAGTLILIVKYPTNGKTVGNEEKQREVEKTKRKNLHKSRKYTKIIFESCSASINVPIWKK